MIRNLSALTAALLMAGCTGGVSRAAYDAGPAPAMPDGYDYTGEVAALKEPEAAWWAGFTAECLGALVAEALGANQVLAQGVANVNASRAALRAANASLLPQASGGLSAASDTGAGLGNIGAAARLSAAYEVDLFGFGAANRATAQANLEAAIFAQRGLELAVQSDVAVAYFNLLASREQLDVARRNLQISERIFEIVEVRYAAGTISGFDVSSQAAQLANVRARIPQLESQITGLETSLAILLGRAPQGYVAPEEDILAFTLPQTDPGLPSDLLLRRPDLMQSEASLRAADASIAAARAAFFPNLDLGAGLGSVLTSGGSLSGSLTASLAGPIFSGVRLEGQLEGAEARRAAALAIYRQSILSALRDVDVSLKAIEANALREAQLLIARDAAADALDAAELRYRAGAGDLTSLLTAQQTFFEASNSYVLGRLDRLTAAVNLYAALGGGY